ncbi:MAG: hypothetical protein QOI47_38 [Actinomycetota bacterium]|nr:hypothetical protein [Actinomycetota bacterium]
MKKSIDFGLDDHPDGGEMPGTAWSVTIADDCEACEDLRVEINVEERGRNGEGLTAHLSPASAKRLAAAIASALKELGA